MTNQITEETRLKVRVGTAWGMLAAIVGTTVWLTVLIVRIHFDNQNEHEKLMIGLAQLNERTGDFVTSRQFEDTALFIVQNLHTNMDYLQEFQIRDALRKNLRKDPKP